jgi:radical SAM protein with 4Fe4S-binding SPASM domain
MNIYTKFYGIVPPKGQTRLCIDPWTKAFIKANGDVYLCCYKTYAGNLRDGTLDEILNSKEAQQYREGLLTGKPLTPCQGCGDKKVCSVSELQNAVLDWYEDIE